MCWGVIDGVNRGKPRDVQMWSKASMWSDHDWLSMTENVENSGFCVLKYREHGIG